MHGKGSVKRISCNGLRGVSHEEGDAYDCSNLKRI